MKIRRSNSYFRNCVGQIALEIGIQTVHEQDSIRDWTIRDKNLIIFR